MKQTWPTGICLQMTEEATVAVSCSVLEIPAGKKFTLSPRNRDPRYSRETAAAKECKTCGGLVLTTGPVRTEKQLSKRSVSVLHLCIFPVQTLETLLVQIGHKRNVMHMRDDRPDLARSLESTLRPSSSTSSKHDRNISSSGEIPQ